MVKCSEVLQCNDGTSNKVSNIIIRHIDNRKLLIVCILLLSHSLIFFRFLFFIKIWLYFMYFYWKRLCILIVSLCDSCLCVVYVLLDAATLTEVLPCFFLSCKANARV